mmetsp:Transcript_21695/g.31570  ORF Transcript_21695/g.31570 Transcript_21695/m.31570 type:complete len:104 (+) Transcript_21695:52-363(+)
MKFNDVVGSENRRHVHDMEALCKNSTYTRAKSGRDRVFQRMINKACKQRHCQPKGGYEYRNPAGNEKRQSGSTKQTTSPRSFLSVRDRALRNIVSTVAHVQWK